MGLHKICHEVVALDQELELRILFRQFDGLGDDAVSPREALLPRPAPEPVQMREGDHVRLWLAGRAVRASLLGVQTNCRAKEEHPDPKKDTPKAFPSRHVGSLLDMN